MCASQVFFPTKGIFHQSNKLTDTWERKGFSQKHKAPLSIMGVAWCLHCDIWNPLWCGTRHWFSRVWNPKYDDPGPIHICSLYTYSVKCSRNKFSVHERSDCEHCEMFSVPLRSDRHDEVILPCTLCADSGLRTKPRPARTCSLFHIVQTSFRRHTKGAICSENMVWQCSSWNCSSGNTTL